MSIDQFIENEVKSNDVVLFMKGTPQFPQCGFSGQVVQILDHVGAAYKGLNVLESAELRDGIKTYSNWPTIPQLYVKGEFVGGCDIIREMFQAGELQQLLADKGIASRLIASDILVGSNRPLLAKARRADLFYVRLAQSRFCLRPLCSCVCRSRSLLLSPGYRCRAARWPMARCVGCRRTPCCRRSALSE